MGVENGKSLSRHAATPLKPECSAILGLGSGDSGNVVELDFHVDCCHSLAHHHQALLTTLWLLHCHLSPLRVVGVHPLGTTGWMGCSTSVQPWKLSLGTSPHSPFLHCKGE